MSVESSTLRDLLSECENRNVRLEPTEDDGLLVDGPQHSLTPDLLDRLRTRKFELLAMLREETDRPTVNLTDANAVWQAAMDELKGDEMFPDELLQILRAAPVAWGREQGSTEVGPNK
jgi:hypothetical protein